MWTVVRRANSLLQHARAVLNASEDHHTRRPLDSTDRQVAARFVEAWQRSDVPALAKLLADNAILRMPPQRAKFVGRSAVTGFFATVPAGGRLDLIDLVEIRANGQPALAAYLPDEGGDCQGYGIMVLDIVAGAIVTITGFPDPTLFAAFGLPMTIPGSA